MQCTSAGYVGLSLCEGVRVTEGPWKGKFDKVGGLHDKFVCLACIKIFFIEILSRLKAWFGMRQRPIVKWNHTRVDDGSKAYVSETGGVYVRASYSNQIFYIGKRNEDVSEDASNDQLMFQYSSKTDGKCYRRTSDPVVFRGRGG